MLYAAYHTYYNLCNKYVRLGYVPYLEDFKGRLDIVWLKGISEISIEYNGTFYYNNTIRVSAYIALQWRNNYYNSFGTKFF